jgi:hypothetical protein
MSSNLESRFFYVSNPLTMIWYSRICPFFSNSLTQSFSYCDLNIVFGENNMFHLLVYDSRKLVEHAFVIDLDCGWYMF